MIYVKFVKHISQIIKPQKNL